MGASHLTRRTRLLVGLGAALVVAVVGSVAWATIPDGQGVYTGCYVKPNGELRVIDTSQKCRPNEVRITWNQAGEPGVQGVPGPSIRGFFTKFNRVAVPTGSGATLVVLYGLPVNEYGAALGPSLATATVNVENASTTDVNLLCGVGENAWVATFDVPGHSPPGSTRVHVSLTGVTNSDRVPLSCHVGGLPPAPVSGVTISGVIVAVPLSSLTESVYNGPIPQP